MPKAATSSLQPRKTPVQSRSAATVDAILEATIQVLVAAGKEQLTTTHVALRAGVSVGTMYQYFPNKNALLTACLKRHMDAVSKAIEQTCEQYKGSGLLDMGTALATAFLHAKMHDIKASTSLYAVSSDIDGAAIAKAAGARSRRAVADLFRTAREGLTKKPEVIASVVTAALNGIARRVLEARFPEREVVVLREELIVMLHAYLRSCAQSPVLIQHAG